MWGAAVFCCLWVGLAGANRDAGAAAAASHLPAPVALPAPAPSPNTRFAGLLDPCALDGVEGAAYCGKVEVWEDRDSKRGRRIALRVVVLPATGGPMAPDPLVYLAGGGVLPATDRARFFARAFAELRSKRDVLLVDQRGSGGSNPLHCDLPGPLDAGFHDDQRYLAAVRRCRASLEKKADLRFYTTPYAMDDLAEVAERLGYAKLNLYGMSYGTKAAMVFLRQHADRVRIVALHGVVPLDHSMSLDVARSAQDALDRVIGLCEAQPACAASFPHFRDELAALSARLAHKPLPARVKGAKGTEKVVTVDAEALHRYVHSALYGAWGLRELPLVIHRAHGGDLDPLAERLARADGGPPRGVLMTIQCAEEIPRVDPALIAERTTGTFIGGEPLRRQIEVCRHWIRGKLPPDYWQPVRSALPILLLTGALDHATPPRYGDRVASTLPAARHLVLAGRGHNDVDPCVTGLIQSYVARGSLDDLDTTCAARSEPITFATGFD